MTLIEYFCVLHSFHKLLERGFVSCFSYCNCP